MFKDVRGKATLKEQIAIEISYLLEYNNIDFIEKEQVFKKAQDILDLINKK